MSTIQQPRPQLNTRTPQQLPSCTYSTPLASVVPSDECYESSAVWGKKVSEVRGEMLAARASGQTIEGIVFEWFMCTICTCMIGPDFHEKDLYLYSVYEQRDMHIADYSHKEPWEPWEGDDGDNLYWEPDKVRFFFDVFPLCGSCADHHRELDSVRLIIASGDWPKLLRIPMQLTDQELLMYSAKDHEDALHGKVRAEIKRRVEQHYLACYQVFFLYLLQYFHRVGYLERQARDVQMIQKQAMKALGLGFTKVKPRPIIPLDEHRQRRQQQQQERTVAQQVYYSPIPQYPQPHSGAIACAQ